MSYLPFNFHSVSANSRSVPAAEDEYKTRTCFCQSFAFPDKKVDVAVDIVLRLEEISKRFDGSFIFVDFFGRFLFGKSNKTLQVSSPT